MTTYTTTLSFTDPEIESLQRTGLDRDAAEWNWSTGHLIMAGFGYQKSGTLFETHNTEGLLYRSQWFSFGNDVSAIIQLEEFSE